MGYMESEPTRVLPKSPTRKLAAASTSNTPKPEPKIYDLDDPFLCRKFEAESAGNSTGSVTCRFRAIPLNEPGIFARDIAQYGTILHENQNNLIMRVPATRLDFLDRIRQIWVSKYLAPDTECLITFGQPRDDMERSTMIIIQRVLPRVARQRTQGHEQGVQETGEEVIPAPEQVHEDGEEGAIREHEDAHKTETSDNGEDSGTVIMRRRSTSLPTPADLAALYEQLWYRPQVI
ncbi:hypothetical protein F4861DRAFT_217236 [Xylaria intraflava]|nr:hypothetical protein F4861DRAFT_217236 [Xylaria intraflava]